MRRLDPWGVLIFLALGLSAIQVASRAARVPISEQADQLAVFAWGFSIVYWIVRDARRRSRVPCHEFGFLVAAAFPISLVWYVFWTRGWRGISTLGGLYGLMCLPGLAAYVTWLLS
jgi:hypothetical protein